MAPFLYLCWRTLRLYDYRLSVAKQDVEDGFAYSDDFSLVFHGLFLSVHKVSEKCCPKQTYWPISAPFCFNL